MIGNITLQNVGDLSDMERIDSNLRSLLVSVEGTIPGSRGFGLSADITDLNPDDAKNDFAEDLDEKIEEFMPEIAVADLDYEVDEGGYMELSIGITASNAAEDEEDDLWT